MSESATDTTPATPDAPPPPPRRTGPIAGVAVVVVVVVALVAYFALRGGSGDDAAPKSSGGVTHVKIGQGAGSAAKPVTLDVPTVAKIRAELPAKYRQSGSLVIGEGALPTGFPPLAFVGSDNKTLTGAEPDFGRLVAAVLGLQPKVTNATWENLFVGIDAGTSDVGFSNITDTEERKQKYDFASYREDNLAIATLGTSKVTFDGDPSVLAGLKVAVSSGTNQEKILQGWQAQLKAKGKSFDIKYFPDDTATWTALESGQIDAYFGPNPGVSYQEAQTGTK
ncbi:MAG: transporter substrate-binding domain-containing protein, partial [Nocardioides sp.]|nr:transporter substrate-binding domain-containing protein [Nocardioides sp.]